MAIFDGCISDAYFLNPENTVVEVVYGPNESGGYNTYVVEVDFANPDFKSLLKERSLSQIEEGTKERLTHQSRVFRQAVDQAYEKAFHNLNLFKTNEAMKEVLDQDVIKSRVLSAVLDETSDTKDEDLFKLKLAIFELEEVKQCKDRQLKASVRKSETKLKTLVLLDRILSAK